MRILIICLFLLGNVVQAQDYYVSSRHSSHEYNEITHEFKTLGSKWEKTRIILSEEYFALEKKDNSFATGWWVYYGDETLGECYITEGDKGKICLDTEDNLIYVLTDYSEAINKWVSVTILSKIERIEPFNIK